MAPKRGHPLSRVRSQCRAYRIGRVGGGHQEEEGGTPPEQARTPLVRGLIQEMGGNPQTPKT